MRNDEQSLRFFKISISLFNWHTVESNAVAGENGALFLPEPYFKEKSDIALASVQFPDSLVCRQPPTFSFLINFISWELLAFQPFYIAIIGRSFFPRRVCFYVKEINNNGFKYPNYHY